MTHSTNSRSLPGINSCFWSIYGIWGDVEFLTNILTRQHSTFETHHKCCKSKPCKQQPFKRWLYTMCSICDQNSLSKESVWFLFGCIMSSIEGGWLHWTCENPLEVALLSFTPERTLLDITGTEKICLMLKCLTNAHCTVCTLGSMFTSQPNKLRHILKIVFWYTI